MKIPANIAKPLHLGSKGENVRILEKRLKQHGLLKGPVDNFFDARTKAAVKKMEAKLGYKTDGIVGNRLWDKITGQGKNPVPLPPSTGTGSGAGSNAKEIPFKTASINVRSNPVMSQDKVRHDVRQASKQAGLIGWQEIGPSRYFDAIKNLGPDWGHYMPRDGKKRIPIPISWKKDEWKMQSAGFMRTHNGLAKVSPHRHISWVKLKHKESGQEIVRINTHLVSGAWSKPKPTTQWRRDMWNIHMNELENLVEKFKKQGLHVVVGGDFNRDSYKVLGNKVKYDNKLHVPTLGKSTLDYLMHTSRKKVLESEGVRIDRKYHSDHHAVVVKYSLDNKKKK